MRRRSPLRATNACTASVWTGGTGRSLPDHRSDLGDGLEHAGLVVGRHHRHHRRARPHAADTAAGSSLPAPSTATIVSGQPSLLEEAGRLEHRLVLDCRGDDAASRPPASAGPATARLSASVPPPVKTISSGCAAPISSAARSRAASIAFLARRETACTPDGLPYHSSRYGAIASRTSGRTASWRHGRGTSGAVSQHHEHCVTGVRSLLRSSLHHRGSTPSTGPCARSADSCRACAPPRWR